MQNRVSHLSLDLAKHNKVKSLVAGPGQTTGSVTCRWTWPNITRLSHLLLDLAKQDKVSHLSLDQAKQNKISHFSLDLAKQNNVKSPVAEPSQTE